MGTKSADGGSYVPDAICVASGWKLREADDRKACVRSVLRTVFRARR